VEQTAAQAPCSRFSLGGQVPMLDHWWVGSCSPIAPPRLRAR